MKIPKGFLLALIIIFIATFVMAGFSQESKKEGTPQEKTTVNQQKPSEKDLKPQEEKKLEEKKSTPSEEAQQKYDYDEAALLRESQRNLDRSLSTINTVATLIGILVGLITIVIIIAIAVGFFEYRMWRVARIRAERNAKVIEEIRNKAEEDMNNWRSKLDKTLFSLKEPSKENKEKLERWIELAKAIK